MKLLICLLSHKSHQEIVSISPIFPTFRSTKIEAHLVDISRCVTFFSFVYKQTKKAKVEKKIE
jgi:hypothetical protein